MKNVLTILIPILTYQSYAQIPAIDVAELTVKVGALSNQTLYYGFAEGDEIIFSFEEVNGKSIKEIEIMELPLHSKFADFKATNITAKRINVTQTAVYSFDFRNAAMTGRICKIKIQRIPKSEDFISFNTNWEWKTVYDTLYFPYTEDSLVGYETSYSNYTKRELVQVDTIVSELFNKVERVHSATNLNHLSTARLNVSLPKNSYAPNIFKPYESVEVISWSYWIGAGKKSLEEYKKANSDVSTAISTLGMLTGYSALATLAVTGVSLFGTPSSGDNVGYKFKYKKNDVITTFDFGNGVSASGRNTSLLKGGFTIELYNDNNFTAIDVNVKMVCVQIKKTWKDVPYKKKFSTPKYVEVNKRRVLINSAKIRVNAN